MGSGIDSSGVRGEADGAGFTVCHRQPDAQQCGHNRSSSTGSYAQRVPCTRYLSVSQRADYSRRNRFYTVSFAINCAPTSALSSYHCVILFHREYYDLMNGLLVLQYLMERQRIPIFESVSVALHCTSKVIDLIASQCVEKLIINISVRTDRCYAKKSTYKIARTCILRMASDL